jgi:hypothetical protein
MGYRITEKFIKIFAGRVLSFPSSLFADEVLCPEKQDLSIFADSMANIVESHKHAAEIIMSCGDMDRAIPPLKALINIMYTGEYNGMKLSSPQFRELFRRESVISSDWYLERLKNKQAHYVEHLKSGLEYLRTFMETHGSNPTVESKIATLTTGLADASSPEYLGGLIGTIGR